MSIVLVAFASSHGQTRAIAEHLATRLRIRGHTVELADADVALPPPPDDYDAVVVGSRVRIGTHATSIADYVRAYRDALTAIPTGFFSVSLSAAQAHAGSDPHDYLKTFFARLGWTPTHAAALGGALHYRRYGWILRFVMKQLARAGGHPTDTSRDHVLTDWTAVDHFTDDFAHELVASAGERHRAIDLHSADVERSLR